MIAYRNAKQPTKADLERWDIIREIGCVACLLDGNPSLAEIHHLVWFGKRRGHQYTVGLCCWHHRQVPIGTDSKKECEKAYGPSLAGSPRAFKERYGDDDELLTTQNELIVKWKECTSIS